MKTFPSCLAVLVSSVLLTGVASAQDAGTTPAPAPDPVAAPAPAPSPAAAPAPYPAAAPTPYPAAAPAPYPAAYPAPGPVPGTIESVPENPSWTALAARPRVGLEYDLWPSADLLVMAWDAGAHLQLAEGVFQPKDRLLLDLDYAWAYLATTNDPKTDQFAYGNPTIGAHLALPLDRYVPDLRVHFGFAWTAPALSDPDLAVGITGAVGDNVHAGFLYGRTLPFYMGFRFDIGAEYRIVPNLYYRGTLNPVVYVPTNGKYSLENELVLEQGNEIEVRTGSGLGFGLRFQEAFTLTSDDLVQTAAELFAAYTPEHANLYGRLGMLVALDGGAGFGFDENKLATVNLSLGYHLK